MQELFNGEQIVQEIPNDVFFEVFIGKLGRTTTFSKLRCGGIGRLTNDEWKHLRELYEELGLDGLTEEEMYEVSYALTARAVHKRF